MNYIVVYYMGLGTILDVSMCVLTDLFNLHILGHRDMANLLKSPFFSLSMPKAKLKHTTKIGCPMHVMSLRFLRMNWKLVAPFFLWACTIFFAY